MNTKKEETTLATVEQVSQISLFEDTHDIFSFPKKGEINNSCLQVRSICSAIGEFNLGGYKNVGKQLKFTLLDCRSAYGNFTGDATDWYQLFFIPSPTDKSQLMKNTTFSLFVKSYGYRTFQPFINDILAQGYKVRNVIITATMTPGSNEAGQRFNIVEWGFEDGFKNETEFNALSQDLKDHYLAIAKFNKTNPLLYHDLPHTMTTWDILTLPEEIMALKKEVNLAIAEKKAKTAK